MDCVINMLPVGKSQNGDPVYSSNIGKYFIMVDGNRAVEYNDRILSFGEPI